MKLSLVIPCFNEENNVARFYEETEKAFAGVDFDWEYVFVNDGSRDGTLTALKELYNTKKATSASFPLRETSARRPPSLQVLKTPRAS